MFQKEQVNKCIEDALQIIGKDVKSNLQAVYFKIENKAGSNVATDLEWQQLSNFFNHINNCKILTPNLELEKSNLDSILNNARIILWNKNDSTYYKTVFNIFSMMMVGKHKTGTKITALKKEKNDVTTEYLNELKKVRKKIEHIISNSDLDFLYNGVLQHTDQRFAEKYLDSLRNKDLDLIKLKNSVLVTYTLTLIKYYTFPLRIFFIQE